MRGSKEKVGGKIRSEKRRNKTRAPPVDKKKTLHLWGSLFVGTHLNKPWLDADENASATLESLPNYTEGDVVFQKKTRTGKRLKWGIKEEKTKTQISGFERSYGKKNERNV